MRPALYTSPSFWTGQVGGSRRIARAAAPSLWVAHWGTQRPSTPEAGWAGNGWTFWHLEHEGEVKPVDAIRQLYLLATEP